MQIERKLAAILSAHGVPLGGVIHPQIVPDLSNHDLAGMHSAARSQTPTQR